MFKKILSLFKSKNIEEKLYTDAEEFYLIKKGYTRQDIEDYFFKPIYIRESTTPLIQSYQITTRLAIIYTPHYNMLDIYFNGIKYPIQGGITIDNFIFICSHLREQLIKGELYNICFKNLPKEEFLEYIENIQQLGKDLHEYRIKKMGQLRRAKLFS